MEYDFEGWGNCKWEILNGEGGWTIGSAGVCLAGRKQYCDEKYVSEVDDKREIKREGRENDRGQSNIEFLSVIENSNRLGI